MMEELVLTFHGIGVPSAVIPEDERPYWISEAAFERLIASSHEKATKAGVKLTATFDDGNRSDIEIAAPLLKRHEIAGIFFPCTGRIGRPGYLDAGDIRALSEMGFEIGSHGVDHRPWKTLSTEELDHEITDSKRRLESIINRPVTAASLPFGSYDRQVLDALKAAGYERIFSSDPGFANPGRKFRRRWSFRSGREFDIAGLARASRNLPSKVVNGLKHRLKAQL